MVSPDKRDYIPLDSPKGEKGKVSVVNTAERGGRVRIYRHCKKGVKERRILRALYIKGESKMGVTPLNISTPSPLGKGRPGLGPTLPTRGEAM